MDDELSDDLPHPLRLIRGSFFSALSPALQSELAELDLLEMAVLLFHQHKRKVSDLRGLVLSEKVDLYNRGQRLYSLLDLHPRKRNMKILLRFPEPDSRYPDFITIEPSAGSS